MDKIYGGAFQLARQIFSSKIWLEKPSSWKIIWIYILGKVNHQKNGKFERGEGFFNFSEERRQIGNDITSDMIKKFLGYARRTEMIDTKRSTRGTMLKVLKYNHFQDLSNYKSTTESTREAREKHERSTPINNNVKNDKNRINKIIAEYIKLKGWDEKSLVSNDYARFTKAIKTLLVKAKGDADLVCRSLKWASEQSWCDWTLETCSKKWQDFLLKKDKPIFKKP